MSTQPYPTHYVLRDIPRRHKLQERICAWEKCGKPFRGHAGRNYCCRQCKSRSNNAALTERRRAEIPDRKKGYKSPADQLTDEKVERIWAAKFQKQFEAYYAAKASPFERRGSVWA